MYSVAIILTQGIWADADAWRIAVVFIVAAVGVLMFGCPHVPVRWKWRLHMYLQSVSAFVVASATARKQDPQIYMIQMMILIPADSLALMTETIEATERATNWACHVVDQGGTLQHQQPSIPQLKQLSLDFMRTLSVPPNHPLDFSALVFEQIQQTLLIDLQTQIDVPYDKQVHKLTRGAYNHHWRSYLQDLHRNVRRLHFGASTNGISHQFRLVGYQLMYELCMLQTPLSRSQEAI